jgi:hypothetical protein
MSSPCRCVAPPPPPPTHHHHLAVLNACTTDALTEMLRFLKRCYWPFAWNSAAGGGFVGAASVFLEGESDAAMQARAGRCFSGAGVGAGACCWGVRWWRAGHWRWERLGWLALRARRNECLDSRCRAHCLALLISVRAISRTKPTPTNAPACCTAHCTAHRTAHCAAGHQSHSQAPSGARHLDVPRRG